MTTAIRRTLILLILSLVAFHSYSQKIMKTYYDYYNIKLKEEYQIDKNGYKNGYYKSFHENKLPKEVGQYKGDLQTGIWKTYQEDGKLYQEATFKEDEYNGITKVWRNGKGFHKLSVVRYFEMGNEIRTIEYYEEGGIQSDIKKDGECKYLYRNTKPAKIWQNQNFKEVSSSVKIWSKDGKPFELQKKVRGINFTYDSDVEFDWTGKSTDSGGYYITTPTKIIGDSAGWKITVYAAGEVGMEIANARRREYSRQEFFKSFEIKKDKADTTIIFKYLLSVHEVSEKENLLLDLEFLDHPKTYLLEDLICYNSKPSSTDKTTIKTTYNEEGKVIKKETGISSIDGFGRPITIWQ